MTTVDFALFLKTTYSNKKVSTPSVKAQSLKLDSVFPPAVQVKSKSKFFAFIDLNVVPEQQRLQEEAGGSHDAHQHEHPEEDPVDDHGDVLPVILNLGEDHREKKKKDYQ